MSRHPRLDREHQTIQAMLRLYCRQRHGRQETLCNDCEALLNYAACRIDRCPYGQQKPACADCPVHCYKPAMRQQIRQVMKYAGPRMILHHPILALRHLIDGRLYKSLDE